MIQVSGIMIQVSKGVNSRAPVKIVAPSFVPPPHHLFTPPSPRNIPRKHPLPSILPGLLLNPKLSKPLYLGNPPPPVCWFFVNPRKFWFRKSPKMLNRIPSFFVTKW